MNKEKLQNSLVFEQNDVWDAVMSILDQVVVQEYTIAISQSTDEQKRSHQCGRAESIVYFKELLNETRQQALKNAGRSA